VLLTDYTQYCSHLGRAYAALTREWAEGHSLSGRAHRTDDRFVGVELFQIESYDATRCKAYPPDPIQIVLGLLSGKIDLDPDESPEHVAELGAFASAKKPVVAPF
jgi:hypothetical protein